MRCVEGVRTLLFVVGAAWCLAAVAAERQDSPAEDPPAEGAPESADDKSSEIESILANPLSDDDYRELSNCVRLRSIDDVEVLDDTIVLFHGRRGELWLNRLSSRCLGLTPDMILNLTGYGGSICRLDRFRGRPRLGPLVPLTAECRLGSFETIDELRAEALRNAISERRRSSDMAKETKPDKSE